MNSGEGSGTWSLLGYARPPGWDWKDTAQCEEDDMSVRELLLKLTGEASRIEMSVISKLGIQIVCVSTMAQFMSPGGAHTVVELCEIAGEVALGQR